MPTLDFKGKQFVYAHHLAVPFRQLDVDAKKSVPKDGKASLDDNLVIHGDNLHALKALLPKYAGKVTCIYVDPPYNTGNEGWCYNDNVNAPLIREWLKDSANPVDKEDLERHDKWLCMMWPRLQLLRELMAGDGVILISVDDNELYNLHCVASEVFGDKNWLGTIVWKNATDNNPTNIAIEHEYILVFAKDRSLIPPEWKSAVSVVKEILSEKEKDLLSKYKKVADLQKAYALWFKDNKPDLWPLQEYDQIDFGGIFTGSRSVHNPGREGYKYNIIHPKTGKPCKMPLMGYRFPESTKDELLKKKQIIFGEDENKIIEIKLYLNDYKGKLSSVINLDGRRGVNELKDIFSDQKKAFDNPKPADLIKELVAFVADKNAIVLDSFAGSGTTGHAVLALNKEDRGNRRFILVECEDYAEKTTAERIRRVIKGVRDANDESLKNGFGGSFTFCELGDEINIENLLKGDKLPSYDELARYSFYTATGQTLDKVKHGADFFVGETANYRVHVIYEPDREFLRSQESAFNMHLAERISKGLNGGKKTALVFATHKFMGQKDLSDMGIVYCQLPYAIHRVMGD